MLTPHDVSALSTCRPVQHLQAAKSAEQEQQFLECIKRLQAIEAALQQMLHLKPETVNGSRPGSPSPTSRSRAVTPRIRQLLPPPDEEAQQLLPKLPLEQLQEQDQEQQGEAEGGLTVGPLIAAWPPGNRQHDNTSCEVTSHQIQTVTTRLFDGSSRLTTGLTTAAGGAGGGAGDFTNSLAQAAEAAATAAKLSHVEFVLVELQELMPLVKAAAQAAAHGFVGSSGSSTGGAGAAPGHVLASRGMQLSHPGVLQHSSSGIADNTEDKQQDQTLHTKEAKASFVGEAGLLCDEIAVFGGVLAWREGNSIVVAFDSTSCWDTRVCACIPPNRWCWAHSCRQVSQVRLPEAVAGHHAKGVQRVCAATLLW